MGWKCDVVIVDDTTRPIAELLGDVVGAPLRPDGLGFRERSASRGDVLPRDVRVIGGPVERVDFQFPRFAEVEADPAAAVSDHCPVRVWFEAG